MTKKILIATGGTGGHIFPAYSLADYFAKKNFKVKVATDIRGYKFLQEFKDLNLKIIPSSPLFKKNIFKLAFSISVIIYSIIKSLILLLLERPSIIFGMGGYSSFPLCVAATILRIKFVIYENNLIIGKANKYLLPFTNKIFVSYKDLEGVPKKYNNKIVEIGNIVREKMINFENYYDTKKFDSIKILVIGGSQGAKVFAEQLPKVFVKLREFNNQIKIYQQCQVNQNNKLSNFYNNMGINYEVFNFTNNILNYYSKANLVITRSGASVLGELINVKIPFISIPLPSSAENHQYKNAEFYEKKGCGFLLEEKDIKFKLISLIQSIFKDKMLIQKILSNQRQYSDKNIFKNLNKEIEKILNEKN